MALYFKNMNNLHVELELLYDFNDGIDVLSEHISDVISDNESEFGERMGRICSKYDMRAELVSETLQVHDVSLASTGGVVGVTYDYDAYYGCKDMCHGDAIEDEWKFALKVKK